MALLTDQVTSTGRRQVLTVGVGPTFAIRWLNRRLADFRRHAPEVDVRITTGGQAAPLDPDWRCGITLGDGDRPSLKAQPLFAAGRLLGWLLVCTLALARAIDLDGATLLRVAHAPEDRSR